VSLVLQVFVPYKRYVRALKWLTHAILAYVGVVFAVKIPWPTVAVRTVVPHITWTGNYATTVAAIFGTTVSPYVFFWHASQEVEDLHAADEVALKKAPSKGQRHLERIGIDSWIGMGFSNIIAVFILLTVGQDAAQDIPARDRESAEAIALSVGCDPAVCAVVRGLLAKPSQSQRDDG
jgi:Mn2+/Fe2+ NRAMP family transporter